MIQTASQVQCREAVGKFIASNYKATRLIIHFYKDLSKRNSNPSLTPLHALGLPIPVIVVTINKTESKELLAFDTSSQKLMPYSGTIVKWVQRIPAIQQHPVRRTSAPTDRSTISGKDFILQRQSRIIRWPCIDKPTHWPGLSVQQNVLEKRKPAEPAGYN